MNKTQQIKRARRMMAGLLIEWTDPTPMEPGDTITRESVTHKSPVLNLQARKIWRQYGEWIITSPVLLWKVDITVVFRYPNGKDQLEKRRVIGRGRLNDIGDECLPALEKVMRYGATPLETQFMVECLGDRSAIEADFDDYEPMQEAS